MLFSSRMFFNTIKSGVLALGLVTLTVGTTSCKKEPAKTTTEENTAKVDEEAKRQEEERKRKEEEARRAAEEKQRAIDEAKAMIDRVANDRTISIEDKLAMLKEVKARGIADEAMLAQIAALEKQLAEEKKKVEREDKSLDTLFQEIASASSAAEANQVISYTLSRFASPNTDVLIVIAKYGDNDKDYDEPTTIEKFLNYIKDRKVYDKKIETVEYDDNKKIKLLELVKR